MRVLVILPDLFDYRVETYNIINKRYKLDVGYNLKDKTKAKCDFEKVKFDYKKIGPIYYIKDFRKIVSAYDVVIIMADFHYPQYCLLPFFKRGIKVISWGIGFRVSYTHPFETNRKHGLLDKISQLVLSKCDANIFYMEQAKQFWKNTNLKMDNVFVAPNTTSVAPINIDPVKKRNFLFVGTLYKGKGLDLLIDTFAKLKVPQNDGCKLVIVGDGAERESLVKQTSELGIVDQVVFKGAIYDEEELANEFQKALICISPTQGGLSVPKSMGYGVPFIVRRDAISGGEIYHINNGVNGIMYEKDDDLFVIMKDALINPQKYIEMGTLAKQYYNNHATPYHMAKGAIDAIDYVLTTK